MSDVREDLFLSKKNGYDLIETGERVKLEKYASEYIKYLDSSRTEREAVKYSVQLAERNGFVEYGEGMKLEPGLKVYSVNRGKAVIFAVIGKKSLDRGAVIAAAHIDSPRLDLKQMPLYEADELCYLKTHYYGGIKKYQWVTIPLELHGTVVLKSGESIDVVIGRDRSDPKFVITDLLPHLAQEQVKKTLAEGIPAEGLNILIGSVPYADEGKSRVKLAVISLLNDMYGITEEDFLSAELCAIPSFEVSEIGFDRSLIGAYGHDDRVCAFAELKALFDVGTPERTCVCVLTDKEEIGSEGVTGMQSSAFDFFMESLCEAQGVRLRSCYEKSFCISADVDAAFDPNFSDTADKRSGGDDFICMSKINYGIGICKYTGARGKSMASDANAETVGYLRRIFDEDKVVWQLCELGKVDLGGGGTVAKYMANRNIETIDAGVPVLSMHSPYETVSKFDCYMTYKGILAAYRR